MRRRGRHRPVIALPPGINSFLLHLAKWCRRRAAHGLLRHHGDGCGSRGREPAARGRGRAAPRASPGSTPGAPVVVLVHGYRYDPGAPRAPTRTARSSPSSRPRLPPQSAAGRPGSASPTTAARPGWPIGFAWPAARAAPREPACGGGRTGFATVYDRAAAYRRAAGRSWLRCVQRLAPGRPVDLLAHSLGARVALAALPHLAEAPGRVILLGAAEFDARAREVSLAGARPRPAAGLQRDGAGQRPLRPRLRDVRAASRLRRNGRSAAGWRRSGRTGSTCSSTGRT